MFDDITIGYLTSLTVQGVILNLGGVPGLSPEEPKMALPAFSVNSYQIS